MQLKFTFQQVLCLMAVLLMGTGSMAQISIPNASFTDAQDFSTLANTGTSSTVPAGWSFSESGTNANALYAAGTGSSTTGDTYSFGLAAPSTERAFGGLQSGSLIPTVGVCYTNNTGGVITGLTVTYTGETWRVGAANRADGIQFQYNQSTTGITGAGTWTSVAALDYFNPGQATGSGTMQHSALITSPVTGLSIQPGATFCFRWNDFNPAGADDGIGVDDYSLTGITVVPANDDCANAIPLTCGSTVTGSNVNATGEPGAFTACGVVQTTAGVWYTFTGNGGNMTLSTCAGASFDTKISVYTGGCATPTCVAGNDDACSGSLSSVTFGTVNGTVYQVLIHGFGGATGTFQLSLTCATPPPVNDLCANAIPLACGDIWSLSTVGAGNDIGLGQAPNCTGGTSGPGVWYSFVGDGGTAVLTTCTEPSFNTVLAVYTGACGALTCVASNDDFCGSASRVSFQTVAGTSYRVLLYGANGESGDYNLQFFCIPANGSATVACPSLATPPTVPTIASNCLPLVVSGPTITQNPNPVTCEGTITYTYTFTDNCTTFFQGGDEGEKRGALAYQVGTWSYTYTIERNPFTVPANSAATVACLANATTPVPPTVTSNCGETLTPTGPVITDNPNPLTCEGTRTYAYTYTDCEGNTAVWSFVYTIERNPFTVPANGAATVACPANATQPTPPTVTSNCGETLTPTGPVITNNPSPITCEGTRTYAWTYTDCEGNTAVWSFIYTIERNPFTVPANGAATVACLSQATAPTLPAVTSNCGEVLTPTGPVITDSPSPLTCEGTRTYVYTYTDCEGNTATWSYVYTIERNPFTVPANGAATVACPANATLPTPPTVLSNCGETLTPTGPVVTNNPNPLTCEGIRTYTWTYTDCEGNTATWSFIYTIERQPFTIATPNGSATVSCPDSTDTVPTPPVVTSNCGEVLTPVITSTPKNACEGDRVYYFTYTDCEGNTAVWQFNYHIEYLDFTVPASEVNNEQCPVNVVMPVPPVVYDKCGKLLNPTGPVITTTNNAFGCEGSRTFAWTYTDCEGNTHVWSSRFNFLYSSDFFAPADEVNLVSCLAYAVAPFPQVLFDNCGQPIQVTGPTITQSIAANGCSGTRTYSYVYRDCGGHTHPWKFTYLIEDNQAPVGTCPGGNSPVSVDVTNLQCIEDVPCPDDYNFNGKIQELLAAGNYFDVCYGDELFVKLVDDSGLWECSDPDNDGDYTFGRTFYFSIADRCGNLYPSLCAVTYSGACQPLETFSMADWGIEGDAPANTVSASLTDLNLINILLGSNPILIGGSSRSITLTDAQCVMNMLPGTGGPAVLSNCQQTNCTSGCNPMGIGGMKNSLAANAIALELNIRYNMQYNGLNRTNIRNQGLGCISLHPCIYYCDANGNCSVRFFAANGSAQTGPYTIGGLQDLVNLYLNGGLSLTIGQKVIYGTALNQSLIELNSYFAGQAAAACDGIAPDFSEIDKLFNDYNLDFANGTGVGEKPNFEIVPNPASSDVNIRLTGLSESPEVSLEVFNAQGQKVMFRKLGTVDFVNERLDISGFGSGIYFVKVNAGDTRFEQKLVISKD